MTTVPRRLGVGADAVAGVVPGEVVRPGTVAEVVEVLRAAAADGLAVVPVGGRSKTGWAAPPTQCDLLLDLTGLDRIVEHTAGDLVVVAEAGVALATLQEAVAPAGQLLALDPPEAGATLGGVVSANASGPRRLRYGTVRDLLIGVTVVLADGTVASAGGKVVKNVAGYDLGKLYTGAHGTLGVVVSTTWRLHPRPAAMRTVVVDLPEVGDAGPAALALRRSTLTPSAVELRVAGGRGLPAQLVVLFEGLEAAAAHQADAAAGFVGGRVSASLPDGFGARPGGPDDLVLRLAFAPASLAQVLPALPEGSDVVASAASGIAYVATAAEAGVAALPGLRAALAPHDGSAVVVAAPEQIRAGLDHWGPGGDAVGLMRRVKDRFDPQHRLSPGRFVGGM